MSFLKKSVGILFAAVMAFAVIFCVVQPMEMNAEVSTFAVSGEVTYGDVNGDGSYNIIDVMMTLNKI